MGKPRLGQRPLRLAVTDTRAVKLPPKQPDAFYLTAAWRNLVARLIAKRGRCCEACGRTGRTSKELRIFGDHIHELRDGGAPLDDGNVRLLCGKCHTTKTLGARGRRMAERFYPIA